MDYSQEQIKILLIDDEVKVRKALERIIYEVAPNWEVSFAEDGPSALRELNGSLHPDIILCDLQMPGMSGYTLLTELQSTQENFNIPFIFLTGSADPECQRRGMNLGADDYLTKPVSSNDLISTINTRLAKSHGQREYTRIQLDQLRKCIWYSMPHELRTPLVTLRGYAEILADAEAPFELDRIKNFGTRMVRASDRLHRLIENYLACTKLFIAAQDVDQVDSMRLARCTGVRQIIGKLVYEKCFEFERQNDAKITLSDTALCIDTAHLIRAFGEILDNAIKFSPAQTPLLIEGSDDGSVYTLSVTNQGKGMSAREIENVGAFMQFNRALEEQQGSGLGLHLARMLTEIHNGKLNIESVQNEYTRVSLQLPLAP